MDQHNTTEEGQSTVTNSEASAHTNAVVGSSNTSSLTNTNTSTTLSTVNVTTTEGSENTSHTSNTPVIGNSSALDPGTVTNKNSNDNIPQQQVPPTTPVINSDMHNQGTNQSSSIQQQSNLNMDPQQTPSATGGHDVNQSSLGPGCANSGSSSFVATTSTPTTTDQVNLEQQLHQQVHQQHQQQSIVSAATGMGGTQTPVALATPSLNANYPLADNCPTQDVKLFVGKIPNEFIESDLLPLFEAWGTVKECVIIRDKCNSQSKGSAFVRMNRLCDADAAIKELHQRRNLGSDSLGPMQVKYAAGEAERIGLSETTANPGIDEAKLFVGSLHRNASEDDLRSIFNRFGDITEVFLIRDPATGLGRGCAFVKFAYKESGLWACRELNNIGTHAGAPRQMEVRFAESKKQQPSMGGSQSSGGGGYTPGLSQGMVGGLGQSSVVSSGGVMNSVNSGMNTPLSSSGIAGSTVVNSAVVGSVVSRGMNSSGVVPITPSNDNPRQVGSWKEYFNDQGRPYYHNEASNVTTWDVPPEFDALDNSNNMGVPVPPAPRSSASNTGPSSHISNDQAGPPGANVFIFHVPNEWSQPELLQAFSPWGTIVSARVAVDKVTQRNKGYAFVSYDNIQSAANAVQQMNGFMAGTKRLKVSIKQGEEQYVSHLFTMGVGHNTNVNNVSSGVGGLGGRSNGNTGGYNDGNRAGLPY